jgi:uncharacterized protein YdeI (BOF family)
VKWTVKMLATVTFDVEIEATSEDEAYQKADSCDVSYKGNVVEQLNKDEYTVEILSID